MNERRRDRRFVVDLPVTMKVGKKTLSGRVINVSFNGLGIQVDDPPGLRQLVQLELDLPGQPERFAAHTMVVHAGGSSVGLEFFGRGTKPVWDEFPQSLTRTSLVPPAMPPMASPPPGRPPVAPPLPSRPQVSPSVAPPTATPPPAAPMPRGPYTGPERRRAPRVAMRIELRLRTPRSIHAAYTADISMLGATLLVEDPQAALGEAVIVNLIQPGTSFSFRRDGIVKRVQPIDARWASVAVEFAPLEPMREMLFADFMNTAYATLQPRG